MQLDSSKHVWRDVAIWEFVMKKISRRKFVAAAASVGAGAALRKPAFAFNSAMPLAAVLPNAIGHEVMAPQASPCAERKAPTRIFQRRRGREPEIFEDASA